MSLGSNIRRIRKARKLSMAELAEKLGTHGSNVQRWETDRVSPRHDTITRISQALGVGPTDLVETDEERALYQIEFKRDLLGMRSLERSELRRLPLDWSEDKHEPFKTELSSENLRESIRGRGSSTSEEAITKERLLSQLMRLPGYKALGDALATIPPEMDAGELKQLAAIVEAFVGNRR